MFAIVDIKGVQYRVEKDAKLCVNRLREKEGEKLSFENVLLLSDGKTVSVGKPQIEKVQVEAKVLKHFQGAKVVVFKKKRRKGYKVKNGHRQQLSEIQITQIKK